MMRSKRMLLVGGAVMVLGLLAVPMRADASGECNSIQSGLWQGVNAALGTKYGCSTIAQPTTPDPQPTSPQPQTRSGLYIALGDSVAAGLGLPVASANDRSCGVSAEAYPTIVAGITQKAYINAACSGATVGDLVSKQTINGTNQIFEPQLDKAFANGVPDIMSITAGANDVYWQYFAGKCYQGTCGTTADNVAFAALPAIMREKYRYALNEINTRSSAQPPQVYVTGYYQPLSQKCTQQYGTITTSEVDWLNARTAEINASIQRVASEHSFVTYVPVDFTGHELCTAEPWVQGLTDNAPIHPTAAGQRAIGTAVGNAIIGS